jgi:hypothetical protein
VHRRAGRRRLARGTSPDAWTGRRSPGPTPPETRSTAKRSKSITRRNQLTDADNTNRRATTGLGLSRLTTVGGLGKRPTTSPSKPRAVPTSQRRPQRRRRKVKDSFKRNAPSGRLTDENRIGGHGPSTCLSEPLPRGQSFGGPDRFTQRLGFQHIIDIYRHLKITDEQRKRFAALPGDARRGRPARR